MNLEESLEMKPLRPEQSIDPGRQQQAKAYARIRRRLMLVNLVLTTGYLLAWLMTGASLRLREAIEQITSNDWVIVLLYAAIFGFGMLILSAPLSYYEGFTLPHQFGMSTQTLKKWLVDQVKGAVIGGAFGLLVLELIYFFLRIATNSWWLWVALILLFFNVVLANLAPIFLMPLFYKFVPLGEDRADLVDRLKHLFERAGTKVQGVYRFDMSQRTKAANAALTGLGNTRRIILGDTLLDEFSPDEIETVLAHELGHHVNRDIPILMIVDTISTLVGLFLASQALRWGASAFGFRNPADVGALPILALSMGLFGLVTMPISNAVSRWRESKADWYALQATRMPTAFASAMVRLANQNLAEADPEPWVEFLLYSHPAISKRVRMAESYAQHEMNASQ